MDPQQMREYKETEYERVTQRIMSSRRFQKKTGRQVISECLPLLGQPDVGMRIIHIAGTNGKGSTAACLNAILMAAGYRCGLFTSPHLIDFAERIQVDRVPIAHADVVRIAGGLLDDDQLQDCTMFDYCLLTALVYFKEQHCDYVILEAGIGGRYDSTRGLVQEPAVSCITRIGYDHMSLLGESLSEIAGQKAGIIRPHVPVVLAEMDEEAATVLRQEAYEAKAPVTEAAPYHKELTDHYLPMLGARGQRPGLMGAYQMENMANAIACADILLRKEMGAVEPAAYEQIVTEGLRDAVWAGRMQILREQPLILLDGAHNPQGVEALCDSLHSYKPGATYTFLIGMLKDKDYESMLAALSEMADGILTVTIDEERGLTAADLTQCISRLQEFVTCPSLDVDTIEMAEIPGFLKNTTKDIVLCGSLHFIGDVMAVLKADETFIFDL